ncbi:TetR family transcriptional regulator [Microtetraspora sp. NBRC 13810]|uniref:TetR/AcrR family transcriptional regulator n=1 Tax=Microtetraspora sp. NBRC 13810 TaxID=3030990 RepID=UPI0024A392C1|nr:TetR/AcrR family transcriptional regulator [Microtetraspora sp. NBRC 13810]GLW06476.1 TetR family transcriptional regulator [Microtetraspora sp. NBRC 13810]
MARPRGFDEDRAIDAAMRAFWTAGYEATSTQDLCEATGLGRSSIYNTFKSKHDLFEKALDRYTEERNAAIAEVLDGPLPIREKIRTLLWQSVEPHAGDPLGCLVVNSMIELAPHDPEIAERLRRDRDWRTEALRAALDAGRRAGEIGADKDPRTLADFFVAAVSGMRVAARGGAGRPTLESIAATALTVL